MKERRVGAVASLPLERGRALGWGRSPFLGQEGVGVVVPSKPEAWTSKKKGCCALQTKGLAKLSDGDAPHLLLLFRVHYHSGGHLEEHQVGVDKLRDGFLTLVGDGFLIVLYCYCGVHIHCFHCRILLMLIFWVVALFVVLFVVVLSGFCYIFCVHCG